MRFAIVSDIHANLQAWHAVMEDVASQGVDHIICLGDIVGYGPNPTEVIEEVRRHASTTVIGNHDAAACGRMNASVFNDNAREAIDWTTACISDEDLSYLNQLPLKARPEGADFLVVHAETVDPMAFGYILDQDEAAASFSACDDRIIFIGHTHQAGAFIMQSSGEVSVHQPVDFSCVQENRYIINPGSVGDPRSTEIVASYVVYDSMEQAVFFRQVEFDVDAYRQKIESTTLVGRPFFLRYIEAMTVSPGTRQLVIPSVEETDWAMRLTPPEVKIKKKDPIVKVGVGVLLLALVVAIWFIATNTGTDQSEDVALRPIEQEGHESKEANSPGKPTSEPPKPPAVVNTFPVTARYLRISLPRKGFVCIAEAQVFSGRENVALRGKATQSSTRIPQSSADKAIDGDMSPILKDGHMTLTKEEMDSWWMVDLGKEYPIDHVILWNRSEGRNNRIKKAVMARLHKFTLEMMDGNKRRVFLRKNNPGNQRKNIVK